MIRCQVCRSSKSASLTAARKNLLPRLGIPPHLQCGSPPPALGVHDHGDFNPVMRGSALDLHLHTLAEEIHLKHAPGPQGMPLVRLTKATPLALSSIRKRPPGITTFPKNLLIPFTPLPAAPAHSSHPGRTSCAQSEKAAFLLFGPRQRKDKLRWARQQPTTHTARAGPRRSAEQKQEAGPCGCYYTSPAPTPEVTEHLHVTICHRGLQASSGPPLQTPTRNSPCQAHELKGQLSHPDGATHPHLTPPLKYIPRLQVPGSSGF